MDWDVLTRGQRISLVLCMVCFDAEGTKHLMQSQDRRDWKVWVSGTLPRANAIVGLDMLVTSEHPLQLEVDAGSYVVPVPTCDREALHQVVDLCSGLGGFSVNAGRLGFTVRAGVDHNGLWKDLFKASHPGATFCCGDLMDSGVLRQLLDLGVFHGVICSGIACQPHSKSLHVSWLLQSAVVILECTPEILRDPQAQEILRKFCVSTGYRLTQAILKLGNAWCGRRDRWIAVLTAPVIPPCDLQDLPTGTPIQVVKDLIPEFLPWHEFDQKQLTLNLYELAKYYQYAAGGVDSAFIKTHEKLPTLLHSAGNQLYTCACGCRAALSETRLRQRGLIGVLIPLGPCQTHMNMVMQHARYLHPVEMWVLMGGHPDFPMGHNLRLAMAGVGQAVAPLMGLWIFAHVKQCIDRTLDLPACAPKEVLQVYMDEITQACRIKWPPATAPTMVEASGEDPIEECIPGVVTISRPGTNEPDVQVKLQPDATGAKLLAAEVQLGTAQVDFQIRVDGEPVDPAQPLEHPALISLVPAGWDPNQVYANHPVPCCLNIDSFLKLVRASDASDPGHITDLARLYVVRHPDMPQVERDGILMQQGPVWGDEIWLGLLQIADNTDADQHVCVWDPLLITGLIQQDVPATWSQLIGQLRPIQTVISAVLLGGHWIPLVWRMDTVGATLHTLAVTPDYEPTLEFLSRVIDFYRGGACGIWKAHGPGFVPGGHCGALVLVFVRHLLWGWPLVSSPEALQTCADELRATFRAKLEPLCVRPMLAGLGVSVTSRLAEMLVLHGVSSHDCQARAQAAVKALGEDGLDRALDSDNPWRELKWLGNQSRPPFMFIKPSELQAQIDLRAKEQPVGHKKHKVAKKSKGKGKGSPQQISLDPASLRLETGIFQSADGMPLAQLGLSQVGPAVAGVVVVAAASIDPYLKAAHPLSTGPLALFVVDSPSVPATAFPVSPERVPLVCAHNSEPALIDGFLIQIGAFPVRRAPMQPGCEVKTVPTCVVKAMVFRDQTKVPWKEVVAHPLLHIFAEVPPLQKCLDSECAGCECWHRSLDFPMDSPVLELWGKQWLRLDFRQAHPEQADLFTAHLRLPECMQTQVQFFSGHEGVYLEPKSLDGRQPSTDFQVIWLPKTDEAQLVGMARIGHKMGLRCRTEHAADVFQTLRPGHTFLPPGKRQTYLVGPFAYGTLQTSVAQVLHSNGWTAKPIQAVAAKTHVQGLMFRVQSVQEPPKKVIRMAHGDVVISEELDNPQPEQIHPKVVATPATESMISKPVEGDYIQQNDPWAKAASQLPAKTATFQIGNPLEDMTQKVLTEVLAQLPRSSMEVDVDEEQDKRVQALEQQLHDLKDQTNAIAAATQQQAQDTATQMQDLRGQIHQQGVHFESAIAAQASSLQGFQDTFQEQFRQQVVHQQTMLDSMFSKQMTQFETLLTKRPRQE